MNRVGKLIGLILLSALCASCTSRMALPGDSMHASTTPSPAQPARLARVDLFSQGVGVFQYQGMVHGTQTQTLSLRSGQINDVLGSLVFQDTGGGSAGEVTFPAATPLSVTLQSFRLDINNNPSRRQLLQQLRGVSLTLALKNPANCKVTGRIIDLLHRGFFMPPMRPGSPVVPDKAGPAIIGGAGWYINIFSHNKLKQIALNNVRSIRINNRQLRRSLNKALQAVADQPSKHRRPITLWFKGHGTRLVRFAYLLETPLWRMTYRLILPPQGKSAMPKKPVLQGLAIVANQTDMNWNNVQLDIRGGEPLSFIKNLYQPLYMWRPIAPAPAGTRRVPQTYSQGAITSAYNAHAMTSQGAIGGGGAFASQPVQMPQFRALKAAMARPNTAFMPSAQTAFNPLQGVNAMASAGVVHPAFDYHVNHITVPRRQSAVVPVLVTPIEAQRLDLYTIGQSSPHPFLAARITNDTHKFLPSGMLTFYTGSIFDGQTALHALPQGRHHVYSYAVDQSVTVRFKHFSQHTTLIAAALKHATLHLKNQITVNNLYDVHNTASHQRTIVARSSVQKDWKILLPAHGVTLHKGQYQYTLKIAPAGESVLHIQQRQNQTQILDLSGQDIAGLRSILQTRGLPKNIVAAIRKAVALMKVVQQRQSVVNGTAARIAQAQSDELRLRQNLQAMKKVSPVYNNIATQLAELDNHLMALQHQARIERQSVNTAQAAVTNYWLSTQIPQTPAAPTKGRRH